jgi:hypothetical protein
MGLVTRDELQHRMSEEYVEGYADGGEDEPVSGEIAKYGYRPSGAKIGRDFSRMSHDQILQVVWTLRQNNPAADRILKIKRDYILGRGTSFETADPDLTNILRGFWDWNKLDTRLPMFVYQLHLFGDQCYPVFVRQADGRVTMGYIDPERIERVITHPENVLELWAVLLKEETASDTRDAWLPDSEKRRIYRIVREAPEDAEASEPSDDRPSPSPTTEDIQGKLVTADQVKLEEWEQKMLQVLGLQQYTGSCFFHRVNAVANQPRGWSSLLQIADWLDEVDSTLWGLADREQVAGYFSWLVECQGANENELVKKAVERQKNPPKRGTVLFHNEKEKWDMVTPDLKQGGSIETVNGLLRYVLGGVGVPEHWFGKGDETNRATAQAQGDPTWRTLEHEQDHVADMMLQWLRFQRDQAIIAGKWIPKETPMDPGVDGEVQEREDPGKIDTVMQEMTTKDLLLSADMARGIAMALDLAVQRQWASHETAVKVWAKVLGELGVDVNPEDEIEQMGPQMALPMGQGLALNSWFLNHEAFTGVRDERE